MNLMEESFQNNNNEEEKRKKTSKILLISIFTVLIAIIGIMILLSQLKEASWKIYLDGKLTPKLENILLIQEDGKIYVPIKEMAGYLNYNSYKGDYAEKSEEESKCYVQCEDEIAGFELDSNRMYKVDITDKDNNYEYYDLKEKVFAKNNILYTTTEGMEKAFNTVFEYDEAKKTIRIYTLPYLLDTYSNIVLDSGYKEISEVFANKKTVLKNMLVVKKDEKTMGVIDTEGNEILGAKYDNITYLPSTGNFLVESNKKMGILSGTGDGKTIIRIVYDSIELMDSETGLYLVSQNKKYGVVDSRGREKIEINNDEIGMDISKFTRNNITNKYILANQLIPARQGNYWGMYSLDGNKVVDFQYDKFGYVASDSAKEFSLLVIPDYNVIVANKDDKYTLLTTKGEDLISLVADGIYMKIEENEKKYVIFANNREHDAIALLEKIQGYAKKENENNQETTNNDKENNTTYNSNIENYNMTNEVNNYSQSSEQNNINNEANNVIQENNNNL